VKPNKDNLAHIIEQVIYLQRKKILSATDENRQSVKYKVETTADKFESKLSVDYLNVNKKLIDVVQLLFCEKTPPLYIGMSNNLESRLSTHFRNLKYLFKQINATGNSEFIDIESYENVDESINFISKFQKLLLDIRKTSDIKLPSINSVYFEYIKFDHFGFDNNQVRELESTLININHPILNTKYK
jgi:hypothetical protein